MTSSARLRREFVDRLQRKKAIRSPAVRDAFFEVPRELFVPEVAAEKGLKHVYDEKAAIVTKVSPEGFPLSSSTQPLLMASMLEALSLEPGHRVLEIGAGTGYNAALISKIVGPKGRVMTIDIDAETAKRARKHLRAAGAKARVVVGDGRNGWLAGAQYDRIIVTAQAQSLPRPLVHQLDQSGLLQIPLDTGGSGFSHLIPTFAKRTTLRVESRSVLGGGFMPLRSKAGEADSLRRDYVTAFENVRSRGAPLASLMGPNLRELTKDERRKLLVAILGDQHSRSVDLRGVKSVDTLINVVLRPDKVFAGWRSSGLVLAFLPDGWNDFAVVWLMQPKTGESRLSSLTCNGPRTERLMNRLLADWVKAGRPNVEDLSIRVSFRRPSATTAWRTIRRHDCWLEFDLPGRPTS